MSAHTPGPWAKVMALGGRYWTLGIIRDHIAKPLESEADWQLALAAPDMYAALKALESAPLNDFAAALAVYKQIGAALNKAEGREP